MTITEKIILFTATVILPTLTWIGLSAVLVILYRRTLRLEKALRRFREDEE